MLVPMATAVASVCMPLQMPWLEAGIATVVGLTSRDASCSRLAADCSKQALALLARIVKSDPRDLGAVML